MEAHDFKLNKVPLYRSKTCEYQCFEVCFPKSSCCASMPLLMQCKQLISLCQVSVRLKEVQMGAHDFKHNKVPLLLENQVISMF